MVAALAPTQQLGTVPWEILSIWSMPAGLACFVRVAQLTNPDVRWYLAATYGSLALVVLISVAATVGIGDFDWFQWQLNICMCCAAAVVAMWRPVEPSQGDG